MELKISGTLKECRQTVAILNKYTKIVNVSRFYENRGRNPKKIGRMWVTLEIIETEIENLARKTRG